MTLEFLIRKRRLDALGFYTIEDISEHSPKIMKGEYKGISYEFRELKSGMYLFQRYYVTGKESEAITFAELKGYLFHNRRCKKKC